VIRWMFTHINVSRRSHCAVHNLTGDTPRRASPDARRPAPRALWLSVGIPYLTAVCCGPTSNGDCNLPVVLALQRVPHCARVSRWQSRHPCRPRRSALHTAPRAYGWCRTRWSCATLAATLQAKHGLEVSAETVRRWLHEMGWVWKRATLVAKDDDPHRIARLARIRFHHEHLQAHEIMVFADELDMHLLPKVGAAWMPQGTQAEVMTPGKNEKHYLAEALHLATGKVLYCLGPRKNNGLFRDLLTLLDTTYPARQISRIYVVADNYSPFAVQKVQKLNFREA
jgi:Winged helix-turn helix